MRERQHTSKRKKTTKTRLKRANTRTNSGQALKRTSAQCHAKNTKNHAKM
jgi:hypothetical protein